MDRIFQDAGITVNMVPFIVKHKHPGSYELVAVKSCLSFLSERFPDFQLIFDYNSFMPTEKNVSVHGIWEAKNRARINTLNNAAEAIRSGWGHGPAKCYRSTIEKAGLGTELERAILSWDIQVSDTPPLSTYLLIMPSILILRFLSNSLKICYSFA